MTSRSRPSRNGRLGLWLAAVVVGMVGMAYASVPLYNIFCRVTGYGGTTQRAEISPQTMGARTFTVRFNADVNPDLPWAFHPVANKTELHVGEERLAFFRAVNESDEVLVGTAVYNVTPQKVGLYFNKVQCFCFTKQTLQPGQSMDFPVSFFIDPDIDNDPNLDDVTTITLSYTFYPDRDGAPAGPTAALRN